MTVHRISLSLRYLVLLGTCLCAQGGVRYGPVIPAPSVHLGNVHLKSPQPMYSILKGPVPQIEVKVQEFPKPIEKHESSFRGVEDDMSEDYEEPNSESSDIGYNYRHHQKKHQHVVIHKHVHKGHVIHDHKHEGEGKHLHKHAGQEHHEHHHHGDGKHEHKHLGVADHGHKHELWADHSHKHKGIGEHKHEHLGVGKHEHKHGGKAEHGHKHEGWADHGHKHQGVADHGHSHKGNGHHEHVHWGDSDHKHLHDGEGRHKHTHSGLAIFSHDHDGLAKHKHSHYGEGLNDHKHSGQGYYSHQHKGLFDSKNSHQGSGHLTYYDDHSTYGDEDYKTEVIEVSPKKKNPTKITKEISYIDPSEFEDFIASLKEGSPHASIKASPHISHKEIKPVYEEEDDYDVVPKKKTKKYKPILQNYDSDDDFKPSSYKPKHREPLEPFSEEYMKFLSRYIPLKSYIPDAPYRTGYSGLIKTSKKPKLEIKEKSNDSVKNVSSSKKEEDSPEKDSEENDPSLIQYNVVHGKKSDIFPSMSYVSTVRNA